MGFGGGLMMTKKELHTVHTSFSNTTLANSPPSGKYVNSFTDSTVSGAQALVDENNVDSGFTMTVASQPEGERQDTNGVTGDNSGPVWDCMIEGNWWVNLGGTNHYEIDFYIPAGTYDLRVGAYCGNGDVAPANVGRFTIDSVSNDIDSKYNAVNRYADWDDIESVGETITVYMTTLFNQYEKAWFSCLRITQTS